MREKILVTATTFPRWQNDTTPSFVYELCEKLAAKYSITVLAPHHYGAKKKEHINNMEIRRFAYFKPEKLQKLCYDGGIIPNIKSSFLAKIQVPLLLFSEFFLSYSLMKKEQISMLHAHWIMPQGFIAILLKKLFNVPVIVTVHGSDLFPLKNFLFMKIQRFVAKNADYVTVNSKATAEEIVKRIPECSAKLKIIPMGIDTNIFKKRNIKKPAKYSKNRILLFVGRLSDQKGLQYLIEAMPDVIKRESSARLLIIGEGSYRGILQEKAEQNAIQNHADFLGALPKSKIAEYYNFADIFVMPSLSNETGTEALGIALLEAMASGCAVIGTNVGGIPYIIKNNHNGILVNQKDPKALASAIIGLLGDSKMAMKLGKNASIFARLNYSWSKIAKDFLKIYKDVLK